MQQEQHEALAQQVEDQAQAIGRQAEHLSALATHQQHELERIQILLTAHLETTQQQVERLNQDHRAREEQLLQDYTVLLHQQEVQFQQALQRIEETLADQDQERGQIHQQVVSLEQSFGALQQAFSTQVEQRTQEIRAAFEQRWRDVAEEKAALNARIENLEKLLEQMGLQIEGVRSEEQERAQAQDRRMHTLAVQLQNEIAARQTLLAHFDEQKKQRKV